MPCGAPAASATSRASRAAAAFSSRTCDSSPYCTSFARLAPKLFVSSTSAPART